MNVQESLSPPTRPDFSSRLPASSKHDRRYLLPLIIIPLLMTAIFSWAAFNYGTPGFRVDKTQHGLHVSTVFNLPNQVRTGDLILGIDGRPYGEILGHLLLHPLSLKQAQTSITVQRGKQTFTIVPHLMPVSVSLFFSIAWPHLLLITLFLLLGVPALLYAPATEPAGLFFFMLCWFATTIATTLPSHFGLLQPTIISLSFLGITLSNWLAFAGFAHFICRFPGERNLCAQKPWLTLLLYSAPPLLALTPTIYSAGLSNNFFSDLQRFRNLALPLIIIGSFIKHCLDLRHLTSPFAKNQVKLTLAAYWLTFAPYFFLYLLPNLLYDRPLISFRIVLLCGVILPAAYLVALFRYRLLGVDRLISRALAYFITVTLLTLCYTLMLAMMKRWCFGRQTISEELFFLFLLIIALILNPLINRIQNLIDRTFFRYRPGNDQLLLRFSRKLAATLKFEELISLIISELPHLLRITGCGLLLIEQQTCRFYPEKLKIPELHHRKTRLIKTFNQKKSYIFSHEETTDKQLHNELKALRHRGFALALPLRAEDSEPTGILLIGPRKDGGQFREDDIRLLATLANQITVALKNSLHYSEMIAGKQQLETLFSKVVQAEKMAALGEMSATLAHEIKNPLGIIRSSAQYLVEAGRSKEITREMLDYIIDEVDGLNVILSNILGLAKFKAPNSGPIDLRREIPLLCDQWQHSDDHNQNIHLHCRVEENLPLLFGDRQQLRQVLLNLLRNSEDALQDTGNIGIEVCRDHDHVLMRVTDDGPGISDEHKDNLFGKFFTTRKDGLGLGLTVCQQIITAHQGTINLKNRQSGGAVACIRLPLKSII